MGPTNTAAALQRFERTERAAYQEAGVEASSRFVQLARPPLRMRVNEIGVGDPTLFLHGGNSVGVSFLPLLAELSGVCRMIVPDRPGCGLTEPLDYRGVDLRRHGVDFVGSLLDALGERRVAVVANSIGGFFALAFALAHPERVSRLALLGEPADAEGAPRLYHRLVGTRVLNTLLYKGPLRPPSSAAGVRAGFTRAGFVTDASRVSDALGECLAAGAQIPGATRAWTSMVERLFVPAGWGIRARESLGTHKLAPELAGLDVPTLFLWGDRDPLGSPETGRRMAASMPRARADVVVDAGHLPWIDQPRLCAEALSAFLRAGDDLRTAP